MWLYKKNIYMLLALQCGCITFAMNNETSLSKQTTDKIDVVSMYWADLKWLYGCIPYIVWTNELELIKNNAKIASTKYSCNRFSATATLRKADKWFDNQEVKKTFLLHIVQDIKKRYPHITTLEYPHKAIGWDFI